jgi:hypothetical protein
LHPKDKDEKQALQLNLTSERFPLLFKAREIVINSMQLFLKLKEGLVYDDEDTLKFNLKNENVTEVTPQEFKVIGSLIKDLPYYAKSFENPHEIPGNWLMEVNRAADSAQIPEKLRLKDKDGGEKNFFQLNPEAIEDIIIMVQYSVTEKE